MKYFRSECVTRFVIIMAGASFVVAGLTGCEHFGIKKNSSGGETPLGDTIAHFDFEKEIGSWPEKDICCNWSATLSDSVKRSGKSSLKIEVREQDKIIDPSRAKTGPRATLALSESLVKEGWFGFSTYFPATFLNDKIEDIVVQWQGTPDKDKGEGWRSPPMMLGVLNDSLVLEIRYDSREVTNQDTYTFERLNLGPLKRESWLDWVFHVKWAYDNTGIVEIWKNNELIHRRLNQPNSYNDQTFPFLKVGLYKLAWPEQNNPTNTRTSGGQGFVRTVFFDNVRVGNEKLNYEAVYPDK